MEEKEQARSSCPLLPTIAAIDPERYPPQLVFAQNKYVVGTLLILFIVVGFCLRVNQLGVESLSEDELNKLQTVEEYRQNGLSGRNGEHPFLMKGLQWLSLSAAEKLNDRGFAISDEAALRFPVMLLGTFTILLLYLLVSDLFGRSIGLVSSALWAAEPTAIGFDRIAKEDSVVLFFFLLANLLWIRGQVLAERGETTWFRWCLLSGVAFAALMSSKYYPWLLATQAAYYFAFQRIPGRRWALGKMKWIAILAIMGFAFLILNPTIMFPETWHEMLKFSSEGRIGHDSYEFMGGLYRNQLSLWLRGVPWTFYYVFLAVKTTLPVLAMFVLGLAFMFRRQAGDGRIFMFFWLILWLPAFTILGGKFTRYFTIIEPFVLIAAATGFCTLAAWLFLRLSRKAAFVSQLAALLVFLAVPVYVSLSVSPHYRLFTNALGGGMDRAGYYFPHDEFYDAATRQAITEVHRLAGPGATVASETPRLCEYYSRKVGRLDLQFISLSEKGDVARLKPGDFVVAARGRRYFSNTAYLEYLLSTPAAALIDLHGVPAVELYKLDETSAQKIHDTAAAQ